MKFVSSLITLLLFSLTFSSLFAGAQEDLFTACKQMDFEAAKALMINLF